MWGIQLEMSNRQWDVSGWGCGMKPDMMKQKRVTCTVVIGGTMGVNETPREKLGRGVTRWEGS